MKTFQQRGGTKASAGFTIANGKTAPGHAAFEMNVNGIRCLNLAALQP